MKKKNLFIALLTGIGLWFGCLPAKASNAVDLSGSWKFQLGVVAAENTFTPDPSELKIPSRFTDTIALPGTTDERHKGFKTTERAVGTYTRRYSHIGRAWYQRSIEIPAQWNGKEIELFIERALWKSTVYVDGMKKGDYDSLATPHIYTLGKLSTGKHTLTICIDNSMIHNIGDKSHSYSENMQTIWNGMLGRMELKALSTVRIQAVRSKINPEGSALGSLLVTVENSSNQSISCTLGIQFINAGNKLTASQKATLKPGTQQLEIPLPANLKRWSEFEPNLYPTQVAIKEKNGVDIWKSTMGFCSPGSDGTHITINTQPTFLRGNIDNCHFPLTGHPPMDKAGWARVWAIYKQFGLNQVRFHSWCPPEAAFAAADEAGIYLQPEAGVWIDGWMQKRVPSRPKGISDKNPTVRDYVGREMKRIIDTYGHHPSFIMFCIGNELGSSDFKILGQLVEQTRKYDGGTRLYSCSTARKLQPEIDDFFVSHRNPKGKMRKLRGAKTNWDYDEVKPGAPTTPLILHELGQWPIYPDWNEINKYTGVVEARNFEYFKKSAVENKVINQDIAFQHATGKFSVRIYKAEIESALRSSTYAGFSMLGLQDYMGQGEATIGILDMFYDLKPGIITPKEYREFCNQVVPLARFPKYIWLSGETFEADIQIFNFSDAAINSPINWKLASNAGKIIKQGVFTSAKIPKGTLAKVGTASAKIEITRPLQCKLTVEIPGTEYQNSWPVWLYPATPSTQPTDRVEVVNSLDKETIQHLQSGGTVLLMASENMTEVNSRKNSFMPVYWSQGWFPGQRNTLGLLCDPTHPLFAHFPTESFCDWQWNDVVNRSSSMLLDDLPAGYLPIVQPIDDFHTNHKFGTIFETRAGKGKLLICTYPLQKNLKTPACKQLYSALLTYAASKEFQPQVALPSNWLEKNFSFTRRAKGNTKTAVESDKAALWVKVADNATKEKRKLPYTAAIDQVKAQESGYRYTLAADGVWKDSGGCFAFGKELTLTIDLPKGVEGTLHILFNDANCTGRNGKLLFENREETLKTHSEKKGVWVKFKTMREDALDNRLQLKATVISGPNLQIDEFIFFPAE